MTTLRSLPRIFALCVAIVLSSSPFSAALAGERALELVGVQPGGLVVASVVRVPAGALLFVENDLDVRADRIEILGTVQANEGAGVTLRAAHVVRLVGSIIAGDGRDGHDADPRGPTTTGARGGSVVLDAPELEFAPASSIASGSGGRGGNSAVAVGDAGVSSAVAIGADGGSGGDVVLLGRFASPPVVTLGNGGPGGSAHASAVSGAANLTEVIAVAGDGGESGRLTLRDGELDPAAADALRIAGLLVGGTGGAGGGALAEILPGEGTEVPAGHACPISIPFLCGGTGSGHSVATSSGSNGANGITYHPSQDPRDHAPGLPGGNGSPASATGGTGGYGYLEGGNGGSASAYGGDGGRGGRGADGKWPGHYNFETCINDCPAIAGGSGGRGGDGGRATATGGRGGDSLVHGGDGGYRQASGGDGGRGGDGGHGGAMGVWKWGSQSDAWKAALGCVLPGPVWTCFVDIGLGFEYSPACGVGGYRGSGGGLGGASLAGGSGGTGLLPGSSAGGSSSSGSGGQNGVTGAPRSSWLIDFWGEPRGKDHCRGTTNPY